MILKPIFKLIQPLRVRCYVFNFLGSVFSGAMNAAESQAARDWQEEMWEKQNEYNLPQNQLKRLQDAGLNPAILAAGGTANTSAPIPSSPARTNWDIKTGSIVQGIKELKQFSQDLQRLKDEADIVHEQAEQEKINTKSAQLDYTKKLYEKDNGFWDFPATMNQAQKDYIISQTNKINEEITTMIDNRQYAKNAESRAQALHEWDVKIKQSLAEGAKYDAVLKQIQSQLAQLSYEEKKGLKELGFDPDNPPLNNIQQYQYWLDTKNKQMQNESIKDDVNNKKIAPLVNICNSLGPLGSIVGAGLQFLFPLFQK
jgi:hypothetical protein